MSTSDERLKILNMIQEGKITPREGLTLLEQLTKVDEAGILFEGNVTIEKGVSVKNSVIWDNVKISSKANVLYDVIGKNCTIMQNARINDFVFIGDDCSIGKNAFISSSIKIWDKKIVENNAKVTRSLIYEDTFFNELFTDSRITGLSNLQINPEFGSKLGIVYGTFAGKNKTVMAGRDIDNISNMIKRSITSGILSSGVNVTDLQVIPIPILRQELKSGGGFGGIFVRKSPFDKNSTDIIFIDKDGRDLSSSKTKSIERLFFRLTCVFFLKTLDATFRIHDLLLTRYEGMALGTNFHFDTRFGRAGFYRITAYASDGRFFVFRINSFFHDVTFSFSVIIYIYPT